MSTIIESWPITIRENEDSDPIVFTYYPNGTGAAPFDFTGYTASMMIRSNVADAAPVLTLTPSLGGAAGTLTIPSITAAQANALQTSLATIGWFDVVLTAPGGTKSHFIGASSITVKRSVTR